MGTGQPVPVAVRDRPDILPWGLPYWKAFHLLSSSRSIMTGALGGGGILPIPYVALSQYARDFGFAETEQDFEEFLLLVRALDEVYIEVISSRVSKSAPS